MHLVGFNIEIYYDTRPYERQICSYSILPGIYEQTALAQATDTFQILLKIFVHNPPVVLSHRNNNMDIQLS